MLSAFHTMKQLLTINPFTELNRELPAASSQEQIEFLPFLESTELPLRAGLVFILRLPQPIDCMDNAVGGKTRIGRAD